MENKENLNEQLKVSLQKIRQQISELDMLDSHNKRSQELFTALFISSPIGIFIVQDSIFVDVNPQFEKMIGLSKAELQGTNPLNLVVPENRNHVKKNAIKMLKGYPTPPYEYRVIQKGGNIKWIMETVTSIQYLGKPATLGNFMDITERKLTEEAARSAGDTSGAAEFSGNAARLAGEKVKKVFSRIESASEEVFAFGEKTQEISKIVDAITNVAQQTNLLALNATIEAARAGEYGRGFAVVAEEVRKLAETAGRSAEGISRISREIAAQASAVVGAMKEGIEELGDGREDLNNIIRALEAITDTARKAAERVNNISELSRDQLDGSAEMVKAIEHISGVARSNASLTEAVHAVIQEQTAAVAQMTSSAQELTNLSLELQTVVTRFRL